MFSDALAAHICSEIASGKTLTRICQTPGLPVPATVYRWKRENSQFSADYTLARVDQMEAWSDEIVAISDDSSMDTVTKRDPKGREYEAIDHENIQRSRLMVDTRWKLMSALAPRYAIQTHQSVDVEVVHRVESTDRERMRVLASILLQDRHAEGSLIEHGPQPAIASPVETLPANEGMTTTDDD